MSYDAIVIGAGAGGGIAAYVLATQGARVLLLEQGPWLDFDATGRDHLRNHRLAQYGDNTGLSPDARRVVVDAAGTPQVVRSFQPGYNHNASAVGSGTLVYGAQAWRFLPEDFRMASEYSVPEGSSLADWPFGREELDPWYARVEEAVGLASDMPGSPMVPTALPEKGRRLALAAEALGWSARRVPLLINSVPRDGRAACVNCQHCVGFACPVDAKNGTQNTVIPRALATGNASLVTGATVLRLVLGDGVDGVVYVHDKREVEVRAPVVVVACGAIETARLLLLSGVENDNLGRNLQGHYYSGAQGLFPDAIWDGIGPGASVATTRFNHGNDGIVGGGMMADDFIALPVAFAKGTRPAGVPGWGMAFREWMAYAYPRFVTASGPVHEIPSAECRVTLDPWVKDEFGRPVARLSGTTHPETGADGGVHEPPGRGLASGGGLRDGLDVRADAAAERGPASGRDVPDGRGCPILGGRSEREGARRSGAVRGRRLGPRDERRVQPGADDHGDGLADGGGDRIKNYFVFRYFRMGL